MQVRPFIFTVLIAFGLAILANSWEISWPGSHANIEQNGISAMSVSSVPKIKIEQAPAPQKALVKQPESAVLYDSSNVSLRIQDLILAARVEKALFKVEEIRKFDVTVNVNKGHVKIEGIVTSDAHKQLIEVTAKEVSGIKTLENKVYVKSG